MRTHVCVPARVPDTKYVTSSLQGDKALPAMPVRVPHPVPPPRPVGCTDRKGQTPTVGTQICEPFPVQVRPAAVRTGRLAMYRWDVGIDRRGPSRQRSPPPEASCGRPQSRNALRVAPHGVPAATAPTYRDLPPVQPP